MLEMKPLESMYVTMLFACVFAMLFITWITIKLAMRKTSMMETQVVAQRLAMHSVHSELETIKMDIRNTRALVSISSTSPPALSDGFTPTLGAPPPPTNSSRNEMPGLASVSYSRSSSSSSSSSPSPSSASLHSETKSSLHADEPDFKLLNRGSNLPALTFDHEADED